MKSRILVSLIFLSTTLNAQQFVYSINDVKNIYTEKQQLETKYEDGKIWMTLDVGTSQKWNSLNLVIAGKFKGSYILGEAAAEKENNTGSENGTAKVQISFWDATNDNQTKDTYMQYRDRTTGYIKINAVVGNKFSGSLSVNIAGTVITGTFSEIEIKGL